MITNSVKRGDIVFYDFGTKPGSDKSGLRPALVLQQRHHLPLPCLS